MMAAVTKRIGFAVTLSATYYPPYLAVRKLSTLDHLTRGRIGWNIVTSFYVGEAENMGLDEIIPPDLRYERAEEYREVCHKLGNSWEPDAVIADKRSGDLGREKLTLREVGKIYGAAIGCPQIVGTPEQIADQMESILEETGGDGFNITPTTMPDSFNEFVDHVVPILQKRGVHRKEYSGTTLRDHLNQGSC